MKIRKERTHQCGLTNLDFRTKGDADNIDRYQPSLKYTDFGTMGKSQYKRMTSATNFKDQVQLSAGWKTMQKLNPRGATTSEFYDNRSKHVKAPVQIGKRKEKELEEEHWTDKVFTGDNPKMTAFLSGQAREREDVFSIGYKKRRTILSEDQDGGSTQSPTKNKEQVHAEADQETQLVTLKNTQTLAGKIDLSKVKDIRRALRRRYATRSNFQKIFTQWDSESKGHIDHLDIHRMMNKMGLKVNPDEALVLLISADQNKDNTLSMNEFMDLIFSQNDALNVDLKNVSSVVRQEDIFHADSGAIESIRRDAEYHREHRDVNQWKLFIQKNLNNISLDLLEIDKAKLYHVDPRDFLRVIERRAKIPDYLKENQEILADIVRQHQDLETGMINYKGFIEQLKKFNYDQATNEKPLMSSQSITSGRSDLIDQFRQSKNIFDDEYIVLDSQKVPPNTYESIQNRLIKVNRFFKRTFGSQDAFETVVKDQLKSDKNGNVTVDQLKNFVIQNCRDAMIQKKITKRDVEGFLSAFVYNAYGATNINYIPSLVFTDEATGNKKLTGRVRGNPPPPETNGDLDTYEVSTEDVHSKQVQQVLEKLEDKVFAGPVKIYQVFKQFDKDGDGYVSYGDIEDHLKSLQIQASKQEVASIIKLFDKDQKGYLDFKAFSAVVHPNMSAQVNVRKNEIHLPNLVPNKDKTNEYGEKGHLAHIAVNEIRKTFQPDYDSKLVAPTRFSAKPIPANTFMHFQQAPQSPGYIAESQRFTPVRHLNNTIDFQKADKERKTQVSVARQETKRMNHINLHSKIAEEACRSEEKQQQKIYKKAVVQETYEKLCHMQSL